MSESLYCTIYCVKNNFDSKVYVGQTWQSTDRRFYEHKNQKKCIKLFNAIQKHGPDNFSIQPLVVCHTQEVADFWEDYFINKYDSIDKGYNIRYGGSKGKHTEEAKKKMSVSHMGKHTSAKTEFKPGYIGPSKLNLLIAEEIREKYAKGSYTHRQLAQEYRVSQPTICLIVKNKTWQSQKYGNNEI
jgi:group I intron endonuclease